MAGEAALGVDKLTEEIKQDGELSQREDDSLYDVLALEVPDFMGQYGYELLG